VTSPDPDKYRPELLPDGSRLGRFERRRERIVAEIQRNRRGEYRVPTWVLAATLLLLLAGWLVLIVLS
jgi:hypothetical protein